MAEKELLEKILQELGGIKSDISDLKTAQASMQSDISDLKTSQTRLEHGQQEIIRRLDKIETKFDDLETKNANNHIEVLKEIKSIRTDLTTIEVTTGKNLQDIAHLKLLTSVDT